MRELTQQEKILMSMIMRKENKQWFYPPDFMPPAVHIEDPLFVGYEASARFSEMAKEYPAMILSERRGKYFYRRIDFENFHVFKHTIPDGFVEIFKKFGFS